MIELRGVSKKYGAHWAVERIDLDCPQGQTQVLIGTSGCGKSTLLRMMIGLVVPDAGYLADRITLLHAGKIVQQGEFADLLENPIDEFAAKFVQAQRPLFS